jgi:type II secretory pathway pseudopilin PulG
MKISKRNRTQLNFNGASRAENRSGVGLLEIFLTIAILAILVALFLPMTRRNVRPAAERAQCKNNLKQIALALYNYEEAYGTLPPACTVDANGQPLHSWRTLILPYLDQKPLYETIDLSKPWNDPANAEAFSTHLSAYVCPSTDIPDCHTTYLALVGPECAFQPAQPRQFRDMTDGTSNIILVIDVAAADAVHWMDPTDSANQFFLNPVATTELSHTGGFQALLGDGTVRFLPEILPPETRQALSTIVGGEEIGAF